MYTICITRGAFMQNDLKLFAKITNRLIFLTTRDEYGSARSEGIEHYAELYAYLNDTEFLPPRGYWTENSLKLFMCRVKKKYSPETLREVCDLQFIGSSSWEYQSYTKGTEVIDRGHNTKTGVESNYTKSYPLYTYENVEGIIWKEHEINELKYEDRKILRKNRICKKSLTPKRQTCH